MKTIIFDCYGTLISTGNGSITATKQILERNDSHVDVHEFYGKWKHMHHAICAAPPFTLESTAFTMSLEKLYTFYDLKGTPEQDVQLMLHTLGRRDVFPEVHQVINELSNQFELVIGSNSDHTPLLADLDRNQVQIHTIFSSESLRAYKPNVEFFVKLLKELSLQPDDVIYVGDSQIDDIQGPNKLGIESIWIKRKEEFLQDGIPKPKFECEDLRGLFKLNL